MLIVFAGTSLADGTTEGPSGLRAAGQHAVQVAPLFRATAAQTFGRGNSTVAISFSVTRSHASQRLAELFVLTHFVGLPKTGNLVFTSGQPGDTATTTQTAAALQGAEVTQQGLSTTTVYSFIGGLPA